MDQWIDGRNNELEDMTSWVITYQSFNPPQRFLDKGKLKSSFILLT